MAISFAVPALELVVSSLFLSSSGDPTQCVLQEVSFKGLTSGSGSNADSIAVEVRVG